MRDQFFTMLVDDVDNTIAKLYEVHFLAIVSLNDNLFFGSRKARPKIVGYTSNELMFLPKLCILV